MDYLNENVAINIRTIRKSKNMSLDMLAQETGVSKSMLGQIERGEANPTLATLGKISSGLRVGFLDLVGPPREEIFMIRKKTLKPIKEEKNNFKNYSYFPFEEGRDFEIYNVELEGHGHYDCTSHGENTKEYIVVSAGSVTIETEGEAYELNEGDAARMYSDKEHRYVNRDSAPARLFILFTWK